jgi:hypothetical protein
MAGRSPRALLAAVSGNLLPGACESEGMLTGPPVVIGFAGSLLPSGI